MKLKTFCSFFLLSTSFLFAEVQHSIIPLMDQFAIKDLDGKVNPSQQEMIASLRTSTEDPLRVMSFNMLFNVPYAEVNLDKINRWPHRKPRLIEYLCFAKPDLIGSQELQKDQLDEIMEALGSEYRYYGVGIKDGEEQGDIPAIFYRQERVKLLDARTFFFSETPTVPSKGPFQTSNAFTVCHFLDTSANQTFTMVNTHFAYRNIDRRHYETKVLCDFITQLDPQIPLLVTGDFNTFPFRQELDLPFYDGDYVVEQIEKTSLQDSMKIAVLGHFGPITSTNFCNKSKKAFVEPGNPGVILDHIFVSKNILVIREGIDPARINGHYPSDHFPVIADLVIQPAEAAPSQLQ